MVDREKCISCGTCEDRCPVGAVKVGDEGAEVDESVCMGCGICTPTCEPEAVRLVRKETIKPLPQMNEFLEARLK